MSESSKITPTFVNVHTIVVLDMWDGPKLVLVRNDDDGLTYLALWQMKKSFDEAHMWLFVPVSDERLRQLLKSEISVKQTYLRAEKECVFFVGRKNDQPTVRTVLCSNLDHNCLPPDDDFFVIDEAPEFEHQNLLDMVTSLDKKFAELDLRKNIYVAGSWSREGDL